VNKGTGSPQEEPLINLSIARDVVGATEGTRLAEDPTFKAAVVAAAIRNDSDLAARLKNLASAAALQNIVSPDVFPGPVEIPSGELALGTAIHAGELQGRIGLSLATIARGPVILTGMCGSGKTTLLFSMLATLGKSKVPFLLIDPEDQGPVLISMLGADNVGIINFWELPLAPFAIPGVTLGKTPTAEIANAAKIYYPRLVARFANQWVGIGGANELVQIIDEQFPKALASGRWPTWGEITAAVRARLSAFRNNRRAEYLQGLLNRLEGLGRALPGINCRSSGIMEYILRKPLIIRTRGLENTAQTFLIELLLSNAGFLLERDLGSYDGSAPRLVVPVEEANLLTSDKGLPSGPLLETVVTSGRKRGLVPVMVTQGLGQMSPHIVGNSHTRVAFCLPDPVSRRVLGGALLLTPDRDKAIATLPRRRFVVSCNSWGAEPLMVEADETIWPPFPGEVEILGWCDRTLKEFSWEPAEPEGLPRSVMQAAAPNTAAAPSPHPDDRPFLTPVALEVLGDIASHVDTAGRRAFRLSLSEPDESLSRKELFTHGLIEEFPERIGKGKRFFTLTAKGEELARAHGFKIHTYKSGPIHEFIITSITAKVCSTPGWSVLRDGITFNDVQLDALLCGPCGWRVGVQVNHNSNISPEAANLAKLTGAAIDRILAVCTSKQKTARLIKKLAGLGVRVPGKVIVMDFDSFDGAKDVKVFVGGNQETQ
jgi:hypothetical protein